MPDPLVRKTCPHRLRGLARRPPDQGLPPFGLDSPLAGHRQQADSGYGALCRPARRDCHPDRGAPARPASLAGAARSRAAAPGQVPGGLSGPLRIFCSLRPQHLAPSPPRQHHRGRPGTVALARLLPPAGEVLGKAAARTPAPSAGLVN